MTGQIRLGAFLLSAALFAGCATPPPAPPPQPSKPQSYVLLLENADGSVGAVTMSGAKGQVVIDRARQGANLDGATQPYTVDEDTIRKDFGAALSAQPQLPATFMLYFESGGAQLTPESQGLIPKVIEAVRGRPAPDVSVIGHTDNTGTAEANDQLGLERAQALAKLMQEAGLKAHDLTIASHGARNLLVSTPPNTAEPRNRRVEITVR